MTTPTTHTISTAKGTFTGTLDEVCTWQAEYQGAFADIDGVSIDDIDFDAEDVAAAVEAVKARLAGADDSDSDTDSDIAIEVDVVIETMPEYLRASHEAAGNSGIYPHNGAERVVMSLEDAEILVENDEDWTAILHVARPGDVARYGLRRL